MILTIYLLKIKKILKAKDLKLVPELTTSGGFHLYAFTSEDKGVEARNYVRLPYVLSKTAWSTIEYREVSKQSNTDKGVKVEGNSHNTLLEL